MEITTTIDFGEESDNPRYLDFTGMIARHYRRGMLPILIWNYLQKTPGEPRKHVTVLVNTHTFADQRYAQDIASLVLDVFSSCTAETHNFATIITPGPDGFTEKMIEGYRDPIENGAVLMIIGSTTMPGNYQILDISEPDSDPKYL